MLSLKLDEIEVAAGIAVRIVAANLRASFVNRAAPLGLMEEHAHRFVDAVFAVPQHSHCFAFVRHLFGEFLSRHVNGNRVMFGQPRHVARLRLDIVIATAIAGTLATVVGVFLGHVALISRSRG